MKVNRNRDSVELSQMAKSQHANKANAAKSKDAQEASGAGAGAGIGAAGQVELSSEAKALASANQLAKSDNPDQEKIDRIKAMIQGGNYKPDFGKVADKMLNESLIQELA
jgi:negative regulator of flagellin synthesis FlgM